MQFISHTRTSPIYFNPSTETPNSQAWFLRPYFRVISHNSHEDGGFKILIVRNLIKITINLFAALKFNVGDLRGNSFELGTLT